MLRGVVAHVRWRYYSAAAINGYTVTRTPGGGLTLVATVIMRDAFKLAQTPLTFEAPHKAGSWKWPILRYTLLESGQLTAALGPEITDAYPVEPPKDLCLDFPPPKSSG